MAGGRSLHKCIEVAEVECYWHITWTTLLYDASAKRIHTLTIGLYYISMFGPLPKGGGQLGGKKGRRRVAAARIVFQALVYQAS